jgi:D-sedoheptulose 7-phosphate isomerase
VTLLSGGGQGKPGRPDRPVSPRNSEEDADLLPLDPRIERQLDSLWRRSTVDAKLDRLSEAVELFRAEAPRLARWGEHLAGVLARGGRLLVAGNGGSAAEAQHLAAELVGKLHRDRPAYSAIALHAETSSLTAIGNDYGFEQVFARQVQAHGRAGEAARDLEITSWAMTGPLPNPLGMCCDDVLAVPADQQTSQELHLVAAHVLCEQVEAALPTVERLDGGERR